MSLEIIHKERDIFMYKYNHCYDHSEADVERDCIESIHYTVL